MSLPSGQADDFPQVRSELNPSRQQQLDAWAGIDEFLIARYLAGNCTAEEVARVEQGMARSQQVRDCISMARDASEKAKEMPATEEQPSIAVAAMAQLSPEKRRRVLRRLERELNELGNEMDEVAHPVVTSINSNSRSDAGVREPAQPVSGIASAVVARSQDNTPRPSRRRALLGLSLQMTFAILLFVVATWDAEFWKNARQNTTIAFNRGPKKYPEPSTGDVREPWEATHTVFRKVYPDPASLRGWMFAEHDFSVMKPVYETSFQEELFTGEVDGQPGKKVTVVRRKPVETCKFVKETERRRGVFRQGNSFDFPGLQFDSLPVPTIAELVGLLDDRDAICRKAAMTALRYQEPSIVLHALDQTGSSERASLRLLVIIDDAELTMSELARPALDALNSEKVSTRWAGLYVLTRLIQSKAVTLDVPPSDAPRITMTPRTTAPAVQIALAFAAEMSELTKSELSFQSDVSRSLILELVTELRREQRPQKTNHQGMTSGTDSVERHQLIAFDDSPNLKASPTISAEPSQLSGVVQFDAVTSLELIKRLIELRSDKELTIRKAALYLIGEIGPSAYDAVESLVSTFAESNDPVEKRWAAVALAQIGLPSERAFPSLIKALDGQDDVVPPAAAFAIGRILESMPDKQRRRDWVKTHGLSEKVAPIMQRWKSGASLVRKLWAEYVLHVLAESDSPNTNPLPESKSP